VTAAWLALLVFDTTRVRIIRLGADAPAGQAISRQSVLRAVSTLSLFARSPGGIRGLVDFALRRGRQEPGPEHVVAPALVAAGHEPTAPYRSREFASRGLGTSAG